MTYAHELALNTQVQPLFDQMHQSQQEVSAMLIPGLQFDSWPVLGAVVATTFVLPAQAADGFAVGRCEIARASRPAEIRPIIEAGSYWVNYHSKEASVVNSSIDGFYGAKVILLDGPKHGELVVYVEDDEKPVEIGITLSQPDNRFRFWPNEGYLGKDSFVMQVEKKGIKVKVYYVIEVLGDEPDQDFCDPAIWKISASSIGPDDQVIATAGAMVFPSLLASASKALADFTNLSGSALGSTTGTTITLDPNAANHGWYLDYTPYLNEAFLPTSNPNEWIARPGSEAEGRMDPLSVLLHEYGHVLGLDHSTNAHDFMAATLTPVNDAPTAGDQSLTTAEDTSLAGNLLAPL